jgi:hypothetical protein
MTTILAELKERSTSTKGALATALFLGLGLVIAFSTSSNGCGPPGVAIARSGFCQFTNFPSFPHTASSLLFVTGAYLSPAAAVAVGWTLTTRGRHQDALWWGVFAAVCLCVALVLLSTLAEWSVAEG